MMNRREALRRIGLGVIAGPSVLEAMAPVVKAPERLLCVLDEYPPMALGAYRHLEGFGNILIHLGNTPQDC